MSWEYRPVWFCPGPLGLSWSSSWLDAGSVILAGAPRQGYCILIVHCSRRHLRCLSHYRCWVGSACFLHDKTTVFFFAIVYLTWRYLKQCKHPITLYGFPGNFLLFSSRVVLGVSPATVVLPNPGCGSVHLLGDRRVVGVHVLQHHPCPVPLRSLHTAGWEDIQLHLHRGRFLSVINRCPFIV